MNLPQGWTSTTLHMVADWSSGGTPSRKKPEFFGGNIPWVKTGELTEKYIRKTEEMLTELGISNSSAKIFPKGSVGIAMYGATIGKVSIWGIEASTNQACAVAQPINGAISSEFLYHFLQLEKNGLVEQGKGGAQPNISQSLLKAWPIVLPPINEQHRIVEKIEGHFAEIDKAVESLKAAKASLDHYRKSLLKAAFEGHLTADWRARNPDKLEDPQTLLSRIRKEREANYRNALAEWEQAIASWKESGEKGKKPAKPKPLSKFTGPNESERSGELVSPKDWLYLPLADLGQISGGLTKNQRRNDLPLKASYLRVANVYSNFLDLSEIKKIGITTDELNKTRLQAGDILFVEGNGSIEQIGRVAVWDDNIADMSHQNHLIRFRVDGSLLPSFALHFLMSPEGRSLVIAQASSTSGLHTLSISKVESLRVPICSPAEQTEIVRILDERLGAADALEADVNASLEYSGALRQSILKQAFSGKLVPQDPGDEPAAALLDRIKAQRAKKPPKPKPRKRKAAHP